MALTDRDFINADGTEIVGDRFPVKKAFHVGHLHPVNLFPTEPVNLGHAAYGHVTAQPSYFLLKALGEPSSGGQPCERFLFHNAAMAAVNPAVFEFEIHSRAAAGQIPDAVTFLIIVTGLSPATTRAGVFFDVCEAL